MDKKLMKRLIALVLTGGILLSSTGVYTALAATEDPYSSEYFTSALEESDAAALETVVDDIETTVPQATETTIAPETAPPTTQAPITQAPTTQAPTTQAPTTQSPTTQAPTTQAPTTQAPTTTQPTTESTTAGFVEEEITQTPSDNKAVQWLGVDGKQTNMGSESNPYAVSSIDHFLAMNEVINDTGFSTKYFRLTADLDFSTTTIDSVLINAQGESGMEGSLVSVNPTLSSSSVFFHLDGNGKRITNLTIESDEYSSLSIFGYVNSSSTISNLTVNNTKITNAYPDAQAAGIILKNEGNVKDCNFTIISLDTTASTTKAESFYPTDDASLRVYSGTAIVVDNSGIIDNETEYDSSELLVLAENVTVKTSRPYAGVVVAQNRGKINKVRARYITVTGDKSKSDYVGGFVGANMTARTSSSTGMYYCEIQTHTNNGGVTGADKIGYLVGYNTGRIQRATVEGKRKSSQKATSTNYDILVYGGKSAGGIVGDNLGDVQLCSALNIGVYFADAANNTIYGGIVGKTTYGVRNCIATGSTAGEGTAHEITRYIGGIVGYGDTSSNFNVENCYALVKIIDSKVPLGAIVGFNGDTAYKNNRIRNVFYSGIISSRPSPVSYGAAGANEGDLTIGKAYAIAYRGTVMGSTLKNTVTANINDFSISGWGDAKFNIKGNFQAQQNPSYYTITGLGTNTIKYDLVVDGKNDKTVVNYDVDITIPAGIGASNEATLLENEPMEFGILNSSNVTTSGSGTKNNPFIMNSNELNFLYYAPAAHFKASTLVSYWTINSSNYTAPSATFWGTMDFSNLIITLDAVTPLFKGIYGSRDDSLTNNNAATHKSSSADDADVAANLNNGVVKNGTIEIDSKNMSNIFGNICNATVKNVTVTFESDNITIYPLEENTGLFAKAVYGNSYIYACYIDSPQSNRINTQSFDGIAGFIGTVDAEKTIIDNCGANIVIDSGKSNAKNCASFIGHIKSLDGGYIQNCYATGGLSGSFDSSSCYLFAGKIDSSSTQIHNCFFSPSYYYENNSNGVTAGIKAGSFTGSCKAWSFVAQNTSTQIWGDITLKVSAADDTLYVESINNIDRFDIEYYSKAPIGELDNHFTAVSSNEDILKHGRFSWYGRIGLSTTFSGGKNASASLNVEHKATGLVAKLTVFNSSDLEIDSDGYYLIKTPVDLYYLSTNQTKLISGSTEYMYMSPNSKIKLAADIDMSGHTIEPIGSASIFFKGEFVAGKAENGRYYTISNLTFTPDNIDHALFGTVQGATIKGVHLDNASITGSAYTAALVGNVYDYVTLEDCKVTNSDISGTNHVGALIGGVQNKDGNGGNAVVIKNCSVENTTVTSTKAERDFAYIGGIVGAIGRGETADAQHAQISGCTVTNCEISAAARGIGGIVGYAQNNKNTITSCTVTGTTLTCTGTNGPTYASLGGIAGLYGGSLIEKCTVKDSTITGECAAGIVTRLTNEAGTTSTISECTVTNSTITSDTIAGGILSQVSAFATAYCYGDKIVDNCKVSADTTVKAAAAGGIVGNIQQFSDKNLTISNCTNLGIIETTGRKGSQTDGAGGIVGRISSGMNTSGIQITDCLSQGTLVGDSNLGGVIGINNGNAHTGANKLVKDCYVTSEFSSKNLAVSKGLIVGFVGYASRNNVSNVAENVVYSSLNTRVPLYGTVDEAQQTGGFDMNKGADQTRGITVDFAPLANANLMRLYLPYFANAVVGYYDGMMGNSNVVELKTNMYIGSTDFDGRGTKLSCVYNGTTYTLPQNANNIAAISSPRFSVGNLPSLTGTDGNAFAVPAGTATDPIFTTTASSSKILVGCSNATGTASATYNKLTDVNIQTFNKKCQAVVKTTYTGIINGETVKFDVGFTVVVRGEHAFDGSGTIDDPFKIYEAEDLLSIKQHHDKPTEKDDYLSNPDYYYEAYYEVMNDIDMTEELANQGMSFAPIGSADEPFRGHIFSTPGNQFAIRNMVIDNPASADDYAYSSYYAEDGYSDALGVFGYTDGAEILDLKFENVAITAIPGATNKFLGQKTGAVVGVATNTTIQSVEVTGTVNINVNGSFGGRAGAIGGIVGEAKDNVVLTDVTVRGTDNDNRVNITGLYQVGGIVGSAADVAGGSITNAVVENANITNAATSGVSIAGGIAGQYSGIITGSKTTDDEGNTVNETRTKVNNVSVLGTVVGGVVGTGNINNKTEGGYGLTIKSVDVTNTNIEVTESVRIDPNASINGIAGGILGTTHESYHYLIEDCTVDSNTDVTSGNCAGGILGKAENRGVGTLQTETSLFIRNCSIQASVTQTNAATSKTLGLGDTTKRNTGVGSVIGVITTNAYTMNQDTMAPQIQITNVTAGGNISGTFNVGGIVGEFASVQYKLNEMTDSIIYDCIVTAKLTPLDDATERFGVILGSIEGNQHNDLNPNEQILNQQVPFPEQDANGNAVEYAVKPFDKIFYSSYTAGEYGLYGLSSVKDYQDPAYSAFFSTIYDVNQVAYNFKSPSDGTITKLPLSIVIPNNYDDPSSAYQWFGEGEYEFTDEFKVLLEANEGSGTPFGFTIAGKDFTLAEDGVQSADKETFEVIPNPDANLGVDVEKQPYKITVKKYATADLVFTYTNGLQIAIPVICGVNFEGDGSSENPIKVENEDIFYYIVKVLPSYSFIQTADLDFTKNPSRYTATDVSHLISNFTGTYDGGNHSITGLTANITTAETPVGIFGKVSGVKTDVDGNVIPNVKDLTFINCTVNGGDADQGTGVFAGAVTDGATVSNIKVQGSTVTSNVGKVGGAVGTVSGATTLDGVEVTGSTVTSPKGSAGGVIGTITEGTVTVIAPKVSDTTVTSGKLNDDGTFAGGNSNLTSGAGNEDIAGGIVAQAFGTIKGAASATDSEGNVVYTNTVENVTVQAYISGGAVGAVYRDNSTADIETSLTITDIRVADTDVIAKSTTATGISGAGLLGYARSKAQIKLDNCYVDKATNVSATGGTAYAAGAVANVDENVIKLDIIDTESYATVSANQAGNDDFAYAAGLVGYIDNEPSILKMDGSVAGGKITGYAFTTYVGGVIGGFTERINTEITEPLFTNGVISAEVECIDGDSANVTLKPVHRYGKFIARYGADMFKEENFATMFADNYYSTYPQDISFFSSESGESSYESLLTVEMFKDINEQGNLIIADEFKSSWNSVAITKNIGSETTLFAKLDKYAELPYGSKDEEGNFSKLSVAAGGFSLVSEGEECIKLVGDILSTENAGEFQLTVKPDDYGAAMLVAEYTCGLKTTGTIISVEIKGTGTEDDPYLISTPTQLRVVAYLAKGNLHFRQINDIDLSNSYNANGTDTDKFIHYNGGKFTAPIGTTSAPFDGVYDGQGYKITGLKMDRRDEDNLGFFGVVKQNGTLVPTIRNVHLELMAPDTVNSKANGIVGNENVGGIVGSISNGLVENCSVAVGNVTGKNNVGGIAGNFTDSQIKNCFTQSDVNAFGDEGCYAGGIVGYVNSGSNNATISGCFASGSIYATPTSTGNDKSNAAGIVSYVANSSDLVIDNCLFTGTTASGYGIFAGAGAMNMVLTMTDCIDAGQNVAMAGGDIFNKITNAAAPAITGTNTISNIYYDSALLKVESDGGYTALPTSKLIDTVSASMGEGWEVVAGYYPVPEVSEITVTTYDANGISTGSTTGKDKYSQAYAKFLSAPVNTSEKEECNNIEDFAYGKGLVYPVTLLTNIGDSKVTYSSSIFDPTDTVAYPEGFDTKLYGIGENKNVDLLFEDKDTGFTSVYRNIFDTTKGIANKAGFEEKPTKNTYVNAGAASGNVFSNGEAYYNAQVPVIFATAEIDGVKVQRDIKVPLSQGTTYCIATQRQLYALGKAEYELKENTKFSNYYGSTYNYKLITDIDCGDNPTLFTPIGSDVPSGYTGQFDGSGHTIKNLKIKSTGDYVGMFSKVSKDFNRNVDPFVKNLTLENATVEGNNYVGTLVGHVYQSGVTIENCHAIGYAEYDEHGNVIPDTITGTVNGTGSYVGGLIGKVDYQSDNIISCSSSVTVSGSKDAVGGLIGESGGTITSCYATGNVICDELTNGNICGVGGLIGIMSNGTITQSFASGNVEVKAFNTDDRFNQLSNGQFGIGGFVGYVAEMKHEVNNTDITGDVITECFSGGNVVFGSANDTSAVRAYSGTAIVGVGGFAGITREAIAESYSSAAVKATFGDIINRNADYGVGVGGIVGVALEGVSDVYSSGSVAPAYKSLTNNNDTSYYGVGGTIGTTMNSGAECKYCYFDSWTNTDPNLTSIGGRDDDGDARSLTTAMLTSGKRPSFGNWSSEVWGFTPSAYPYLKALLNEGVDNYIKTNSILSVVCVNVADDDVSAKTGAGVTMALTVPTEFKYTTDDGETVIYKLDWAGATLEGNLAAINRSQNVREYVDVVAQVVGLEEYATRVYSRLCADMKGTFEQPYLIGNERDLNHVNMTAEELEAAKGEYKGFYDQWATPLDAGNNQVEGKVHYQLMSNVSVTNVRNIPAAPASYTYTVTSTDEQGDETTTDKTFNYQGFMLKGNGYAIKDVTTTGYYFQNIDENSMLTNIIFDNFTFTGSNAAIVGTNKGELLDVFVKSTMGDGKTEISNVAGLVYTNQGTIDGCVADATIKGAKNNVGILAVNNSGTIRNSGTAGSIDTPADGILVKDIGAFIAKNNNGTIENSFSMADVNINIAANADVQNVSGFAANSSGLIDGVYTRSAVSFANEPKATTTIASLVGNLTSANAEPVKNSYAAGLLGYFNENQDSILFGTVPETMGKLESVYVDKSLAGEKSADSYKYSASLSSIMSMQYMADTMKYDEMNNPEGKFIAGEASELVLPQLSAILNAENHKVVDEEGNLIYIDITTDETYTLFTETVQNEDDTTSTVRKYRCSDGNIYFADEVDNVVDENGSIVVSVDNLELQYSVFLDNKIIIRNYDVIKAYSKISSMTLKTAQSQYADRLVPNSSATMISETETLDSSVSTTDGINYGTFSGKNDVIGINNSTDKLTTYGDGKDSIKVNYANEIELSRGTKINPQLLIDVAVNSDTLINTINPNFEGGLGTKTNPYVIHDAASLQSLHYYGTESDLYFVLGNDIDMSGIDDFQIHVFTAHLNDPESVSENPSQYTISNFTSTKGEGGLFGRVEQGAVINNVALAGANIISDEMYVGALANRVNGGTITNCVVSADVTSTSTDAGSATGVLAGRVNDGAVISGIVTTGNAVASAGAVGGVIGYAENATMSEFVSTANVCEGNEVAGIIGTMGENATLTNVLYGGVADSKKPIVATSYADENAITNAYYDTQLNKGIESGSVIGEGKTTKECENVFENDDKFVTFDGGFYPVPTKIADVIAAGAGFETSYESYGATAALAAATMNFYLGSSRGEIGFYTSMQFADLASATGITVTEKDNEGYFTIEDAGKVYVVKSAKYNETKDPTIVLTLANGAKRTINPGLVRNANISYTITNPSNFDDVTGKTLGVLLKSVSSKTSNDSVNVLNDFTTEIGTKQTVDALIIAEGMDGFYVGEMLPAGYEYKVSATLNGKAIPESDITTETNIYGTFVKLPTGGNGDIETKVELTLEIVESDSPWGVNSIKNILW